MVRRAAVLFAVGLAAPTQDDSVDLARWAAALPAHFAVHGVKQEPTWEEAIEIRRDGDLFKVTGGAPGWAERATEAVALSEGGSLIESPCEAAPCGVASPPAGFLATAALVSASARGRLRGTLIAVPYGTRHVICVPAEMLGDREPYS